MDDPVIAIRMKYAEDIEELLQCPVCFETPIGTIPTCIKGHHICEKCKRSLVNCPQCHSTFNGSRNYMAETLASKFTEIKSSLLDPKHKSNKKILENLTSAMTQTDPLIFHKMNSPITKNIDIGINNNRDPKLESNKYDCIVKSCNEKLMLDGIIDHFQQIHKDSFIEINPDQEAYVFYHNDWKIDLRSTKNINYAINVLNKGLFFFSIHTTEKHLKGDIKILSDNNNKYYYFIEVEESLENEQASKAYDGTVQSFQVKGENDKSSIMYEFGNKQSSIKCTLKLYNCMKKISNSTTK